MCFKGKVAVDRRTSMGTVGPHKHTKWHAVFPGKVVSSCSHLLSELSVPLSDQKASSFMSGILNVSVFFMPSSRRKGGNLQLNVQSSAFTKKAPAQSIRRCLCDHAA